MQPRSAPKYYPFVEGIRGLAAFYVVLNHIWARFVAVAPPDTFPRWFHLLKFGHVAVAIFIVLSGFCLMLPIAPRAGLPLSPSFLKRRAWRILPAYFAAMLISLLLGMMVPAILPPHSREWQSLLTHVLLVHNWTPRWSIAINGPFWSIALECQIYFLFALLLLPIRRYAGRCGVLAVAAALVAIPMVLRLDGTSPWFLLLFVQGMLAAEWVAHPPRLSHHTLRALAALLTLVCVAAELTIWRDNFPWPRTPWQAGALLIGLDLLLGSATAAVLIVGALAPPRPFALLCSRPVLWLGSFSYSLYLLHDPLLALGLHPLASHINSAPLPLFSLVLISVLPVTLGLCWLFHLAFERPFLRSHNRVQ